MGNTDSPIPILVSVVGSILLVFIFIIGIAGNALVVHATERKRVFKIDQSTITFIRHLAITDILYIVFNVPPLLYHLVRFRNRQVGGREIMILGNETTNNTTTDNTTTYLSCYGLGNIHDAMVHCNVIFIIAISLNRFVRCLRPMQMSPMTRYQTYVCLVVVWGMALSPSLVKVLLQSLDIVPWYTYNERVIKCTLDLVGGWDRYNLVMVLLSFLLIALTNLGLLLLSIDPNHRLLSRKMKRIKMQSFLITGGISLIFLVSWSPAVGRTLMEHIGEDIPLWVEYSTHLYIFNTFINPVLYLLVNAEYWNFVCFKIKLFKIKTTKLVLSVRIFLRGG